MHARGFYDTKAKPVTLTRKSVDGIQLQGGQAILGTSRGGANLRRVCGDVGVGVGRLLHHAAVGKPSWGRPGEAQTSGALLAL